MTTIRPSAALRHPEPQRLKHNTKYLRDAHKCVSPPCCSLCCHLASQEGPIRPPSLPPLLPTRPPIIGVKQLRNSNIAPPTDGYKCQHTLSLRLTHPWGSVPLRLCVCYANRLPASHIFCANQIREGVAVVCVRAGGTITPTALAGGILDYHHQLYGNLVKRCVKKGDCVCAERK